MGLATCARGIEEGSYAFVVGARQPTRVTKRLVDGALIDPEAEPRRGARGSDVQTLAEL